VVLTASEQQLTGDIEADSISAASLTLKERSVLAGAINAAATAHSATLALDTSST